MKKFLCLALSFAIMLSLTSCMETSPAKEINGNTQPSVSEQSFALNETAVFDTLKITATEMKESSGTDFFKPEAGNVFVGINFTIENISSEEQAISSLLLFEAYADDIKCAYSINAACAFSDGTLDGSLASGKKMVGWYAVEVPANWSNIELNVEPSLLSSSSAKFVFKK